MSLVMPLAFLMAAIGTLYLELMPDIVSPATTVWMMAAPFDGAFGPFGAAEVGMAGSDATLGIKASAAGAVVPLAS